MIIAAQPEVKLWLESLDIETDDLLTLFLLIDVDGDGTLTLEELLSQIPRLRGAARGIDMLAMRKGIPTFQLLQEASSETEKKYQWSETARMSRDKIGAITEATFCWGDGANKSGHSLDDILA